MVGDGGGGGKRRGRDKNKMSSLGGWVLKRHEKGEEGIWRRGLKGRERI